MARRRAGDPQRAVAVDAPWPRAAGSRGSAQRAVSARRPAVLRSEATRLLAVPRSRFRVPGSCSGFSSRFEFNVQRVESVLNEEHTIPNREYERNAEHEPGTWIRERGTSF